jgi:hypothetical protein
MATQNPLLQYQQPYRQTSTGPTMGATYSPGAFGNPTASNYTMASGSIAGGTGRGTVDPSSYLYGGGSTRPQATMNAPKPGYAGAFTPPQPKPPLQNPGNNMYNPGYDEQALIYTQNALLNDPYAQQTQQLAQQAANPSSGESYLNQNLGSLQGPGQGQQYWQQVQGQFMDPFAGEQFARQATQDFASQGPASAFFDQAMGQYGDFTGYTGPQNSQGQYGQAQQQLGNGTIGQQNLQQLAGQYGNIGQYTDPNLSAGQYAQTQQAFGDLPIAEFDPFYDRARQLGVQAYNQGAAGRGVYGSSEALSGVGNVITDIEAQRANRAFDAEMQRAQEQRARQQLLGEQARMGDLSSLAAFGANLSGVETFGNLNNQMGQLQNQSQSILGDIANNADSQAARAQEANIAGLNAFGELSNNADRAETDRYEASTHAMNEADRTGLERMRAGADVAFRADDSERADYNAETAAAASAAGATNARQNTAANIMNQGSDNDLDRVNAINDQAQDVEGSRQGRMREINRVEEVKQRLINDMLNGPMADAFAGDQQAFEDYVNTAVIPALTAQGLSQQDIDNTVRQMREFMMAAQETTERATEDD